MGTPSSISPHANVEPAEPAELIYHIARLTSWQFAVTNGLYPGDTLTSEGFIHFSSRQQVVGSGNRFFRGQKGLLLLEIDPRLLGARLVYEASLPGAIFPHLYGPLEIEAVVRILPFEPGPDGLFSFPD